MSEIALVSARKARLEGQANKGDKRAKAALDLATHPDRFLSTVQIGITLIGILTGIYSGEKLTDDFVAFLNQWPALQPTAMVWLLPSLLFCLLIFHWYWANWYLNVWVCQAPKQLLKQWLNQCLLLA